MEAPNGHGRTVGELVGALASETESLLRLEIQLAKTEMSEKLSQARSGFASIGVGAGVAYAGMLAVVAAASIALSLLFTLWMPPAYALWLGPLVIGAVVATVGFGMVRAGRRRLAAQAWVPKETVDSLREDKEWLKEQVE